jgi:hypothetical protein
MQLAAARSWQGSKIQGHHPRARVAAVTARDDDGIYTSAASTLHGKEQLLDLFLRLGVQNRCALDFETDESVSSRPIDDRRGERFGICRQLSHKIAAVARKNINVVAILGSLRQIDVHEGRPLRAPGSAAYQK